ncbi:MAG: heavy-metal-associated domain-containing protein [Spirochaetota bacterium]
MTIKVEGMMCNHCAMRVEKAIKSIEGVKDVSINLEDGTVTISGDFDETKIEDVIFDEGYKIVDLGIS